MRTSIILILTLTLGLAGPVLSSTVKPKKKILYIDSYHLEYIWSADIFRGIKSILDPRDDVELKVFRMDTKRHKSEDFKRAAARRAKELIESWQPDLVITSDDNAAKYLIAPYYLNADLPFVFCGLNWDASVYGLPTGNVTGMVEVALYRETIEALKRFTGGTRIGYLASDTNSERKELANIQQRFRTEMTVRLVKTFAELKEAFLDLQRQTDMLIIQECRSVEGFDHHEMIRFVNRETLIPSGSMQKYLNQYVLMTLAKSGEEQGKYAAATALRILDGQSPGDIPVAANHRATTYLNMKLARKLAVKFPMELIESAKLISAKRRKILLVNSYHRGYKWSDGIEAGLLKALNIQARPDGSLNNSASEVELKIYRMDTKLHQSVEFIKQAARRARQLISDWRPDLVITSDDNAVKYLLVPYFRDAELPFVFCGVNWDAAVYGLPFNNTTGMVERVPVQNTIELLKRYARGERIGYIGSDTLSMHKNVENFTKMAGVNFSDGSFCKTFSEWQHEYLRLQEAVDLILWFNPIGIKGWDDGLAKDFILANTRIPTGGTSDNHVAYALLGRVKLAVEQGWWAGRTAINILEGTPPTAIPLAVNRESRLYLNMELAKRMGIKFPMEWIAKATFISDMNQPKSQ